MRNLRKIEKPLALLSFLCLFPAGMSAQSIVKGVVTDPSGEPIIGIFIIIHIFLFANTIYNVPYVQICHLIYKKVVKNVNEQLLYTKFN